MKKYSIMAVLLGICLMTSCKKEDSMNYVEINKILETKFGEAFNQVGTDSTIRSAVLRVEIPRQGYVFSTSYGNAEVGQPMAANDQFFSASVGKTVTAAMILELTDEGVIDLDQPIANYLPASTVEGLSVYSGTDYSQTITVRQLLNHTSGLPDFLLDGEPINGISPFFIALFTDVNKTWGADEIIVFHKQNMSAIAAPGQVFHYSDTNYQLLGLIIEHVTGKILHEYAWENLLQPFEMKHTYYFFHENERGSNGRMASTSYLGDIPLNFPGMSFDWSAGGLITSAADLKLLLEKVLVGNYISEENKAQMKTWISTSDGYEYGLGLMNIDFGSGQEDFVIGHLGATNSFAMYCPKYDAYITGTLNQLYTNQVSMTSMILSIIEILEAEVGSQ